MTPTECHTPMPIFPGSPVDDQDNPLTSIRDFFGCVRFARAVFNPRPHADAGRGTPPVSSGVPVAYTPALDVERPHLLLVRDGPDDRASHDAVASAVVAAGTARAVEVIDRTLGPGVERHPDFTARGETLFRCDLPGRSRPMLIMVPTDCVTEETEWLVTEIAKQIRREATTQDVARSVPTPTPELASSRRSPIDRRAAVVSRPTFPQPGAPSAD
jgi:hypothetical protein